MTNVDIKKAEDSIRDFLLHLGQDLTDPNLKDTPKRVTRMFCEEILNSPPFETTTFETVVGNQFVSVFDINVSSMCSHHLLPVTGKAHIGTFYIADDMDVVHLPGLSKYARVVNKFARKLQLQERMGSEIVSFIQTQFNADFVYVHLDCHHHCMSHRGIKDVNSNTTTTHLKISQRFKDLSFSKDEMINDFYNQLKIRTRSI